jgi:4-hydroxy-3-methylbut-2-enyl diphosphate reductase
VSTAHWLPARPAVIGITAGASCPNNLIEDTIRRLFDLYQVDVDGILRN